jgi:hypothetical protein
MVFQDNVAQSSLSLGVNKVDLEKDPLLTERKNQARSPWHPFSKTAPQKNPGCIYINFSIVSETHLIDQDSISFKTRGGVSKIEENLLTGHFADTQKAKL